MPSLRSFCLLIAIFSLLNTGVRAQSSILASGQWIKLAVDGNGLYAIGYDDLQSAGMNLDGIAPENFAIFGNGGGMLPQPNDSARPFDLEQVAVYLDLQMQGNFQPGDQILFYAEGPDFIHYNTSTDQFDYQRHLFSRENYYFLTILDNAGERISEAPLVTGGAILSSAYTSYVHEEDQFNILHSGRQWFGEKFDLQLAYSFPIAIPSLKPGSEVKIISSVMSSSQDDATFDVSLNNVPVGTHTMAANPSGHYARKGNAKTEVFSINQADIPSGDLILNYKFNKISGIGYLDYFIMQAEIELIYLGEPLIFYTGDKAKAENRTVEITNCPQGLLVWDISIPNQIKSLPFSQSGDVINFNISSATQVIGVFAKNDAQSALQMELIPNQNLKGVSATDLLIVTSTDLMPAALEIAQLRENDGLTTKVVSDNQIYNEFSSGKQDITAIRDYARYLYNNVGLKYLLILGKGTYDPLNHLGSGLNIIPIYESRNSLSPLATYSSDDYLGFMEDHEGEWAEDNSDDHTLDIGVGRIPVVDINEATIFVNKLKMYGSKEALGSWRKDVVFVAENGDLNIHQRDAERLTTLIDTTSENFSTHKIYVDAYEIEVNPGYKRAPDVNNDLYEAINKGALVVNYTGHGNETQWANTRIFDTTVIDSLKNDQFLPLFVTATCEFGRHDDTGVRSGGENLVIKNKTGAIAAITTARPVFASSNYQLNVAFYNAVFERVGGNYQRLGDIMIKTKNNSLNGVLNRNFSLLGDPSMRLSYGKEFIAIDSLNGQSFNEQDTLPTLERLKFSGSIRMANWSVDHSFSGEVKIQLLDKVRTVQTLGNLGNTPFKYKVRDNILFNGRATVLNGYFSFSMVLPTDVSYNAGDAKITLYAVESDSAADASGANIDFLVGASPSTPLIDNDPPHIDLFMGDTTYTDGMPVNPNSLLIARLSDDNGINTSSNQVGHSITYTLDGQEPIAINNFYVMELDDYKIGWVYYELPSLIPGWHTITIKAWDTSNNSGNSSITFFVTEKNNAVISNMGSYPNPMTDNANITFAHNLPGENLEVIFEVMNTAGQVLYAEKRQYHAAPMVIDDWAWDGRNASGGKLRQGLYIFGIFIRSNSSNLTQQEYSRLFISN